MRVGIAGFFAVAVSLCASQMASAADLPAKAPVYKAPVVAAAYNWSGFYAGINAGYAWNNAASDWSGDNAVNGAGNFLVNTAFGGPAFSFGPAAFRQPVKADGFTGGVQAGYNWQFSNIVAGLEADFQYADLQGRSSNSGFGLGGAVFVTATSQQNVNWFGTVRPRLGVLLLDQRLLAYATGGLAYGQTELNATIASTGVGAFSPNTFLQCPVNAVCIAGSESKTSIGWTAGGGLEWQLWSKVRLRAEYLHVDLGRQSIRLVAPTPAIGTGFADVKARSAFDIVRAGVSYAF
jgi:outer membrane immunogenic protein